jgi:hypothetical protein
MDFRNKLAKVQKYKLVNTKVQICSQLYFQRYRRVQKWMVFTRGRMLNID